MRDAVSSSLQARISSCRTFLRMQVTLISKVLLQDRFWLV